MRRATLGVLALGLLALFVAASSAAAIQTEEGSYRVYLPFANRPAASCDVPGSRYGTLPVAGPPANIPANRHPDLNLTIRGWRAADGRLGLVDYGPGTDPRAPQLDAMFADRRLPGFTDGWDVYQWNWDCMCREEPGRPWDISLLGLRTAPGEVIYTPDSGYDISGGYDALVLYASPTRLTLKYTREDSVAVGYAIHLEQICVEPDLLALYRKANAAGRGQLPAVRGGQPLGRSNQGEILVSVRDSGAFLDPRSHHDWWKSH